MVRSSPHACSSAVALLQPSWGGSSGRQEAIISCYCEGISAVIQLELGDFTCFFSFRFIFLQVCSSAIPQICKDMLQSGGISWRLPEAALFVTPKSTLSDLGSRGALYIGLGAFFLLTAGNSNPTCSSVRHIGLG